MKFFVDVLFTAAVATMTGAIVNLRGRRERGRVEKKARESLVLARDELRAVENTSLLLCAAKDKKVEAAEKKVHFLADLLTSLETDVQCIMVEAKGLRRKAEHVSRYSEARTSDTDGARGANRDREKMRVVDHVDGRRAQEKPGDIEEGLHVTSEERSSHKSESALDVPLLKCPTAELGAERELPSTATSGRTGTGLAVNEGNSTYKRGGRGGRGREGRGGYRQPRGAEGGQGYRGGRGEGVRGVRGRGRGRGRGSRGSRRSERGAHRGPRS